jgi:hypothetical protein
VAASTQFGVDAWRAVAALGRLVGLADVLGERLVGELARRRDTGAVGVVGGTGDLQQLARALEGALLRLLRLDEQLQVHRVSLMLLCQAARALAALAAAE